MQALPQLPRMQRCSCQGSNPSFNKVLGCQISCCRSYACSRCSRADSNPPVNKVLGRQISLIHGAPHDKAVVKLRCAGLRGLQGGLSGQTVVDLVTCAPYAPAAAACMPPLTPRPCTRAARAVSLQRTCLVGRTRLLGHMREPMLHACPPPYPAHLSCWAGTPRPPPSTRPSAPPRPGGCCGTQ